MKNLAKTSVHGVFTGIHSTFSRGDYFSVEGVPLAKITHVWSKGEPDNDQDREGCIVMSADGTFADKNCSGTFPYICYKKFSKRTVCGTSDLSYILDNRTGSCYKFHQFPRTWSRAYMTCAAENAYLAVINSETEGKALGELFLKKGKPLPYSGEYYWDTAHIGFHDWGEHGGQWITVHGDNLKDAGYDKFNPGEPNNYSIYFMNSIMYEFCGGITKVGTLDDMWCERRAQFICEMQPEDFLSSDED
ncbi:hemolymph lipopolysaccharide-binding protein-like [Hyposmocoma kahamanoa]|uniref:hemolymph lipopolysaccharide-binding protein-like n=1 Tax=Hyposmocoma kahamanoa TaxID=1477025 RepID=UPI000E6D82AA|nr:hemolymph lipopolysaccharide-binding protein-like [Hyposmocoma kahamanoa]